jgi:hypothetical protein
MQSVQTIDLGHVRVVSDPSLQPPAPPAAGQGGQVRIEQRRVGLDEARRTTPFRILEPAWLPSSSLKLDRVQQLVASSPSGSTVLAVTLVFREQAAQWVVIKQQPHADLAKLEVPFVIQSGTIAGRPAALMARAIPATGQPNGQLRLLIALLERGDLFIEVQGPNLSESDMSRIANSLN